MFDKIPACKGETPMKNEMVSIRITEDEKVSGILSIPGKGTRETGIILAHGAGNDMNQSMLAFLAEGLADEGYISLRFNFLYREKGKKSPDKEEVLYRAWLGAYRTLADHHQHRPKHIIAAGKSMGGRIASQLVAEKRLPVERLILLGYPLHSPGKKDRLQDGHLYDIGIPMLFFAGTRDQLCDLELLRQVLSKVAAPSALEIIEGGDHSFNVPKSYAIAPVEIYEQILCKMIEWASSSEKKQPGVDKSKPPTRQPPKAAARTPGGMRSGLVRPNEAAAGN
jgi:predicted alpha/beta-hydrolase family hydrolase